MEEVPTELNRLMLTPRRRFPQASKGNEFLSNASQYVQTIA